MGLMQKACETYDVHSHLAGLVREGHETLAPIAHTMTSAQLEITLDPDGCFVTAREVDKKEPKIVMPVTEASAGRTNVTEQTAKLASKPYAHPLCEQLGYLSPCNPNKQALYLAFLSDWAASQYGHPALAPVLSYVRGGTILNDLERLRLIELDEQGGPKKEKLLVRWVVAGLEGSNGRVWEDKALFDAFIQFYRSRQADNEKALDMISGSWDVPATQHPKGVVAANGNAKLISANDDVGFTYRGRFTEASQACTVSYISSQKAHNALRWLAADQGVMFGNRAFLCWNPRGRAVPRPTNPFCPSGEETPATPTAYKEALQKAMLGYRTALPDGADVILAAFDAATSGRLAVTYYGELRAAVFLEHLLAWDGSCCWHNGRYGIQSPPLYQIVDCAFGAARTEDNKATLATDDRVKSQQMQRLLASRVNGGRIPRDIEAALVRRAANLQLYQDSVRRKLLFTACAAIRKTRMDDDKEEWSMALEPDRRDISYQFGRLLAVMEWAEQTYYDSIREDRETNAIRQMPIFCQCPLHTVEYVNRQLRTAYLPRMKPWHKKRYQKLFDEIMEKLSALSAETGEPLNRPLRDVYLLGYSNQRNELYQSHKHDGEEDK